MKEYYGMKDAKLTFAEADIADRKAVNDLFNDYLLSIVVNLAAQAGVRYSIDHLEAYQEFNLIGFFQFFRSLQGIPC